MARVKAVLVIGCQLEGGDEVAWRPLELETSCLGKTCGKVVVLGTCNLVEVIKSFTKSLFTELFRSSLSPF